MDRMYRVLGFWTLMISIMAYWAHLYSMAMLFFALTVIFVGLSYMGLSEKTYIHIFFGFMFVSFVSFTVYTFFLMPAPGAAEHSLLWQAIL